VVRRRREYAHQSVPVTTTADISGQIGSSSFAGPSACMIPAPTVPPIANEYQDGEDDQRVEPQVAAGGVHFLLLVLDSRRGCRLSVRSVQHPGTKATVRRGYASPLASRPALNACV